MTVTTLDGCYKALEGSGIPEGMHDAVAMYLVKGYSPGHFLTAVLENNLREACARADEDNIKALPAYVAFLYRWAPAAAWGTPNKVAGWNGTEGMA